VDGWHGVHCDSCGEALGCVVPRETAISIAAIAAFGFLFLAVRQFHKRREIVAENKYGPKNPKELVQSYFIEMGSTGSQIPMSKLKNLELIAAGSQGQVYKAQYGRNDVAVKKYFVADQDPKGGLVQSWKREASILKSMRHPNILMFYGICLDACHVYLVTGLASFTLSDAIFQPFDHEMYDYPQLSLSGVSTAPENKMGFDAYENEAAASESSHEAVLRLVETIRCQFGQGSARADANLLNSAVKRGGNEGAPLSSTPSIGKREACSLDVKETHAKQGSHIVAENRVIEETSQSIGHRKAVGTSGLPLPRRPSVSLFRAAWNSGQGRDEIIRQLVLQTIEGIAFVHKQQIIHRDIKPDNLLILEKGDVWAVKLADFGMARFRTAEQNDLTTLIGSPHYVAPELMKGERNYNNSIDIYSFGMVVWALVHEQNPMNDYGIYTIVDKIVNRQERPEISAKCSPFFCNLISLCWDSDPANRPTAIDIRNWCVSAGEGNIVLPLVPTSFEQNGANLAGCSPADVIPPSVPLISKAIGGAVL
jgi:serine/threonine protein kinase